MDSEMIFQYSRDEFKSLLKEAPKEILAEDKFSTEDLCYFLAGELLDVIANYHQSNSQ